MSYCCCTPQIRCRYCQKSNTLYKDEKPFFKLSTKAYDKFIRKLGSKKD